MPAYTNMAWPEDPYGTGQLWRREPPLLAAFAVLWSAGVPAAYAVAYLRLHRTQAVDLSSGVGFGFRAVVAATGEEMQELVRLFDLDALRARRLAKVVAGYCLARDLHQMTVLAAGEAGRGIRGLADAWDAPGEDRPGLAQVLELGRQGGDGQDLVAVSDSAGVGVATVARAFEPRSKVEAVAAGARRRSGSDAPLPDDPEGRERDGAWCAEWLAACSVERALVCAVTAGRRLDRHTWDGALDIGAAMAANAWDCFASQDLDRSDDGSRGDRVRDVTRGTR